MAALDDLKSAIQGLRDEVAQVHQLIQQSQADQEEISQLTAEVNDLTQQLQGLSGGGGGTPGGGTPGGGTPGGGTPAPPAAAQAARQFPGAAQRAPAPGTQGGRQAQPRIGGT